MPKRVVFIALLFCFSASVWAENWPWWRGPSRQGESKEKGLPVSWSAESNLVWKAEIPGESWSSPIVWEDKVFVTTATDTGVNCHVMALNAANGEVLWSKKVIEQVPRRKEGRNSYATPTPATDGRAVYAVFGDGSIVALSFEGEVLWVNRDVKFYSRHGLGASPVLHEDLLIMPFDGSTTEGNERIGWQIPWDKSFILALDKKSGKESWRAKRGQSRIAHVTPNIYRAGGQEQLVSGAGDVVQGFDLEDGERLWSVYSQGEGVVPSVVIADGLIYTASGFEKPTIRAVSPPTGSSEEAKIVWEQNKGVPSIPSFVHVNGYLFAITDGGIASCLDAKTGEQVWQERVGGNHSASPVAAEGRIYFLSESGECTIIKAGPEFEVLARNTLPGKFQASMAVSNGRLFLRSNEAIYAVGQK